MARFIAIPVTQGDAFFLERENLSVIIDGGRNRFAFPTLFQTSTRTNSVDVVVCTHNDADHTDGVIGYFEGGLQCNEVWLPGRWLSILPDVLRPFVEVFVELVNNVSDTIETANIVELSTDRLSLETYSDYLKDQINEVETEGRNEQAEEIGHDGWTETLVPMLERAEPWRGFEFRPWLGRDLELIDYIHYRELSPRQVQLLFSAIDAASRIRTIAIEAYHRGIPVRWFEYSQFKAGGGLPELQPLNATAIARVRPRIGTLLKYLTLTVSNKQSLVFWSPPTDQLPGVLFTADSDLAGVSLPTQFQGALVTAPHHGSEANACAYREVESAAKPFDSTITWIRSDGRYRSRPGSTYRSITSRRLCTICRRNSTFSRSKQPVQLFSRDGRWVRHPETTICECQVEVC